MSQGADGDAVVGVLGARDGSIGAAVESAGASAVHGPAAREADLAALVAVGEDALGDLLDAPPTTPVVPVAAGSGVRSIERAAVADAVAAVLDGAGETIAYPVLGVSMGGTERARALFDCMLVTEQPARISEYAVRTGETPVAQFRADGVVVATAAGSHGYARGVGAPVLAPGTGVGVVAPVAPFATDPDHWALPLDSVSLSVERDDEPVVLLADDRTVTTVEPGASVGVAPVGTLPVHVGPGSPSPFPGEG